MSRPQVWLSTGRVSLAALGGLLLALGSASAQSFPPYPGTPPVKEASPSPEVVAGGTIVWTITIFNDAFDGEATVFLSDDVPDPADGLPVPNWSTADILTLPPAAIPTYNGDRLSVSNIVVPARGSSVFAFRTRVLASAAAGTQICNTAYFRYIVTTCGSQLCQDESFQATSSPPGATSSGPTCVTVTAPTAGQDIRAAGADTVAADRCPSDAGFPAPDGILSPGETVDLTLAIQNLGTADATANPAPITGTIQASAGYTVLSASSPYITTVVANNLRALGANVGTNSSPFVIRLDPALACPGTITVPLVVSNIRNGPYTVNQSFAVGLVNGAGCLPKCLEAALSAGPRTLRDSCGATPSGPNGVVQPGDDIFLRLPVRNAGPEDLRGAPAITGTLSSITPGVSIIAGSASSSYPDLLAGATVSNATEFGIHIADTIACGTAIDLLVTLSDTEAGTRAVAFTLAVASPCVACPACSATASASAGGPLRFCAGGSVRLDGGASTVPGCAGSIRYQWLEGGSPVPGANASSYDVPTTAASGSYSYELEVSCSTDPGCSARSQPLAVVIDPAPLVVRVLQGVVNGRDAVFSWVVEPSALGGYRLYSADHESKIPLARVGGPPGVSLVATSSPGPLATTLSHVGGVDGPPANPALLHYQALALCGDGSSEGPN